jgi:HlyD family secretion protein
MKRQGKWILGILLFVIVIGSIIVLNNRTITYTSTIIEQEPLRQILGASGKVVPDKTIEIQSQVMGIIKERPVQEGQTLEAGDIIAILDDTDARNSLSATELSLKVAKNNLYELDTSGVIVSKETLNQAGIALETQRKIVLDYQYLYENGALELQKLENARSLFNTFESQYKSALASYRAKQKNGSVYESTQLQIEQANAEIVLALSYLDKHIIKCPKDGVITEVFKETGELVQVGSSIALLAENPRSYILLKVDEMSIGLIELGQNAVVWPESNSRKTVEAVVDRVDSKVDEDTGTVDVRLLLVKENHSLIQDMTVRAEIVVRNLNDAIVLPANYLYEISPAKVLVRADDKISIRSVTAEAVNLTHYMILAGLEPGEEVLLPEDGVVLE